MLVILFAPTEKMCGYWDGMVARKLTSGDIGLLTGPHQTLLSEPSSFTIRLSDGERPVFAPEYAERAPEEVMAEPVS